jgi:hypothetical protein
MVGGSPGVSKQCFSWHYWSQPQDISWVSLSLYWTRGLEMVNKKKAASLEF